MCEICRCLPCLQGCPNAPDPPIAGYCKYCDEPVYDGEECYELDGDIYHLDCFDDDAVDILIKKFGAERHTATADDGDYYG